MAGLNPMPTSEQPVPASARVRGLGASGAVVSGGVANGGGVVAGGIASGAMGWPASTANRPCHLSALALANPSVARKPFAATPFAEKARTTGRPPDVT